MKFLVVTAGSCLAGLLTFCNAEAQDHSILSGYEKRKANAIEKLNSFQGSDSQRVNALFDLLKTAQIQKQRIELLSFYAEAKELSNRLNYSSGRARSFLWWGQFLRGEQKLQEAQLQYDSAIKVALQYDDPEMLKAGADAHRAKGAIFAEQESYYNALSHYFESLKYYEQYPEINTLFLYKNITLLYLALENTKQALTYAHKGARLSGEIETQNAISASFYLDLASIYLKEKDFRLAEIYLKRIRSMVPDPEEYMINTAFYERMGSFHFIQHNFDSAYVNYKRALDYIEKGPHALEKSKILAHISRCALEMGSLHEARSMGFKSLQLAEQAGSMSERIGALNCLSDFFYRTGNSKKAMELLQSAYSLKDSLLNENTRRQMNTLATIYETDKNHKEILRLENVRLQQAADIARRRIFNRIYIGAIIGLLMGGFLLHRNFRNKQLLDKQFREIQWQKIQDLEKNKQLLTVNAILKGQEEERNRIAKDLHDGLGGMLSGVKLSLANLSDQLSNNNERSNLIRKTSGMLDNTIGELRKVAHNLMPEILLKFGLKEALGDFCHQIRAVSGMEVIYQFSGNEEGLSQSQELNIYRIVQELVNNVLKHASANQLIVQLAIENKLLLLTVEDNGRGFDVSAVNQTPGAGLLNVGYRVNYLNGTSDIVSEIGSGTSINIEIRL